MSYDWVLEKLGEIYKNAHELALKTNHPNFTKILNLCNEMAVLYKTLKDNEEGKPTGEWEPPEWLETKPEEIRDEG